MPQCKALLLPLILVMAAACTDASPPPASPTAQRESSMTSARSQRLASPGVASASTLAPPSTTDLRLALDLIGLDATVKLTSPHADAAQTPRELGVIQPRKGSTMFVMSTGVLNSKTQLPEPGTDFPPHGVEGDAVTLTVTLQMPAGANRLSFDYNFLSAEAPDFVGSDYNDKFTVRVTDKAGTRVVTSTSVNSAEFFDVSDALAKGTGFNLFADDPNGVDSFLDGFPEGVVLFPDAGITGYRTVNVAVERGGEVTLEFDIRDLGDGGLDSAVIVDNIDVSGIEVTDPNTEPPSLISDMGSVKTDLALLATGGSPTQKVAADGVTQLVVRSQVPGPGKVRFKVDKPTSGSFAAVGGAAGEASTSILVDVKEALPGQYYAIALYTSPEDFNTLGDELKPDRPIQITGDYTADDGTVIQNTLTLLVVRPPVLLIPDMWTDNLLWESYAGALFKNVLFNVERVDTSQLVAEGGLNDPEYTKLLLGMTRQLLKKRRADSTAATQVDVVAHGTGGLLVRKFVDTGEGSYLLNENFRKGFINRLITMNTPHLGVRLADEMMVMRAKLEPDDWSGLKETLAGIGIHPDGKENGNIPIDDLKTDGPAINGIKKTDVPSHLFVSVGGETLNRGPPKGSLPMLNPKTALYIQMERLHPLVKDREDAVAKKLILGTESMIFCKDKHDLFVPEADQRGGIAGSTAVSTFTVKLAAPDSEHFKVPRAAEQNARLLELLHSPVKGGAFAPFIPSPRDVVRTTTCSKTSAVHPPPEIDGPTASPSLTARETRVDAKGQLKIVSPGTGTSVSPGSMVKVSVEASGGFEPRVVFITGGGQEALSETFPFTMDFQIPAQAIGSITLRASGIDAQGHLVAAEPVVLPVALSARLTSLEVLNGNVVLQEPGSKRRLRILGHYTDGVVRDVSSSPGTLYSSSNLGIATVTGEGLVTATGKGIATLTVRHGSVHTSVNVTVSTDGAPPIDPCIKVRLGDYNLFALEDYSQGHYIEGRVAAGGNIFLEDFSVGEKLSETDTAQALVAGGDLTLTRGGAWGDVWHGGQLFTDSSVSILRGSVARGTPLDFTARGNTLRALSTRLATLPANGTTTVEPWGGVLLRGTSPRVNVFEVDARALRGIHLLSIEAPAGSLALVNVRGSAATLSQFGQSLTGGIDERGVLFNLPNVQTLMVSGYGFVGTLLAPEAHVSFNDGAWAGGLYLRSLTGNGAGHLNPLRDTDICP